MKGRLSIEELLLELAEACSQLVSADHYDVQIVKDSQAMFVLKHDNEIRLKKTSRIRKNVFYTEILYNASGTQLGW